MKHIDDLQHGGVITDPVWLHTIRDMVKQRDELIAEIVGDKVIVKGVVVDNNNNVSDGLVVFNNKLYTFKGGYLSQKITVKKVEFKRPNHNRDLAPFSYEDVMSFGNNGTETFDFNELTRIEDLKLITSKLQLATVQEIINDDLEKLFTLKTLLSRTPTQTRRALVRSATLQEIKEGTKTDVFVTPQQLNRESHILMIGTISSSGGKMSSWRKDFTCSRVGTGRYRINHNLNSTMYAVIGAGINTGVVKVSLWERQPNYCIVGVSDDHTVNDSDFSFQIFKIA